MLGHGLRQGSASSSSSSQTAGAFWHNPSETFVDVEPDASGRGGQHSYWMSEAGSVDLFLFGGPSPEDVVEQYTAVTGTTQMPPMFAIAYHQCRWNYKNEEVG
jgi:alpha 1,3-glucosidase